jgi:hypothetical protein
MPRTAMRAAFPAPDESQVTLANWMIKPFKEWGFRNVRQILPTANIGRSPTSIPLQLSLGHLEDVRFEGLDGTPTTLRATLTKITSHPTATCRDIDVRQGGASTRWAGWAPARCSIQRATHWGLDRDGPNRLTMEARP